MLALLVSLAAGCGSSSKHVTFSARVDNPWFPLKPGIKLIYTGVKDGKRARDLVTVAHGSKTIAGAP